MGNNAKLIHERENDCDFERDYLIKTGEIITLRLNDDLDEISFYDSDGDQLDGSFEFAESETNNYSYLVATMNSPMPKHGLGRAALEFFIDITGASLFARTNDGNVLNDGSNLTENAPEFVGKMINEGLLLDTQIEDIEEY